MTKGTPRKVVYKRTPNGKVVRTTVLKKVVVKEGVSAADEEASEPLEEFSSSHAVTSDISKSADEGADDIDKASAAPEVSETTDSLDGLFTQLKLEVESNIAARLAERPSDFTASFPIMRSIFGSSDAVVATTSKLVTAKSVKEKVPTSGALVPSENTTDVLGARNADFAFVENDPEYQARLENAASAHDPAFRAGEAGSAETLSVISSAYTFPGAEAPPKAASTIAFSDLSFGPGSLADMLEAEVPATLDDQGSERQDTQHKGDVTQESEDPGTKEAQLQGQGECLRPAPPARRIRKEFEILLRSTSHGLIVEEDADTGEFVLLDDAVADDDVIATNKALADKYKGKRRKPQRGGPPIKTLSEAKNGATAKENPRKRKPLALRMKNFLNGRQHLEESSPQKKGAEAFELTPDEAKVILTKEPIVEAGESHKAAGLASPPSQISGPAPLYEEMKVKMAKREREEKQRQIAEAKMSTENVQGSVYHGRRG
jgi:hypothetical protein